MSPFLRRLGSARIGIRSSLIKSDRFVPGVLRLCDEKEKQSPKEIVVGFLYNLFIHCGTDSLSCSFILYGPNEFFFGPSVKK